MKRVIVGGLLLAQACLGRAEVTGDHWVSNQVVYPFDMLPPGRARPQNFGTYTNLHAETLADNFKVLWAPQGALPNATVKVYVSAAELGHWKARDWHAFPMTRRGTTFEAVVPVEAVEIPLVYFVCVLTEGPPPQTNCSPMRVCIPEQLGLLEPTEIFWAFLEGFEEGIGSWRLIAPPEGTPPLRTDPSAKSGNAALLVTLPAKQNSLTIGTTQLRGWQLKRQGAIGIRLWVRTRTGNGRAKLSLLANAWSPEQKLSVWPRQMALSEKWQKADLFFSEFPGLDLKAVDFFTVELIGKGPMEFFLDDVQLIGPWRVEPE